MRGSLQQRHASVVRPQLKEGCMCDECSSRCRYRYMYVCMYTNKKRWIHSLDTFCYTHTTFTTKRVMAHENTSYTPYKNNVCNRIVNENLEIGYV